MTNDTANKGTQTALPTKSHGGIPELTTQDLHGLMRSSSWPESNVQLVDVRMPDEFTGELGHIGRSKLVTLGPDLQKFLDEGDRETPIVFICRSGARSGHATGYAIEIGYSNVANLTGGMMQWNAEGLPVSR